MQQVDAPKIEDRRIPLTLCLILTVSILVTIILGFYLKNPLIIIIGIVPAAIYEAIRTEGYYTKAGSIAVMVLVILEILAIRGLIKLNLANLIGAGEIYFSGYFLPLGELTFIFPIAAAIISLVLIRRTYGIYTKWLSVLLLISSLCLLYLVNKESLFELLRYRPYY